MSITSSHEDMSNLTLSPPQSPSVPSLSPSDRQAVFTSPEPLIHASKMMKCCHYNRELKVDGGRHLIFMSLYCCLTVCQYFISEASAGTRLELTETLPWHWEHGQQTDHLHISTARRISGLSHHFHMIIF